MTTSTPLTPFETLAFVSSSSATQHYPLAFLGFLASVGYLAAAAYYFYTAIRHSKKEKLESAWSCVAAVILCHIYIWANKGFTVTLVPHSYGDEGFEPGKAFWLYHPSFETTIIALIITGLGVTFLHTRQEDRKPDSPPGYTAIALITVATVLGLVVGPSLGAVFLH